MSTKQQKRQAAEMLASLKTLFDSLPLNQRKEILAALKELSQEVGSAAEEHIAARRSAHPCFARF